MKVLENQNQFNQLTFDDEIDTMDFNFIMYFVLLRHVSEIEFDGW